MLTKQKSLRKFFAAEYIAGKARKYIRLFNLRPGDRVLIVARKSGCERRNNLHEQVANLRRIVESAGAIVVGVYAYVGSGWYPHIGSASLQAKQCGANVLLAETTDRFVRNLYYDSVKRPNLQATDEQLAEIACDANGITLMTHLHPDATPGEVRSYQAKRGQQFKHRKGGRPRNRTPGYKKERQQDKIGLVLWLHRRGWSMRRIAKKGMVNVPKSTVCEWIHKHS